MATDRFSHAGETEWLKPEPTRILQVTGLSEWAGEQRTVGGNPVERICRVENKGNGHREGTTIQTKTPKYGWKRETYRVARK